MSGGDALPTNNVFGGPHEKDSFRDAESETLDGVELAGIYLGLLENPKDRADEAAKVLQDINNATHYTDHDYPLTSSGRGYIVLGLISAISSVRGREGVPEIMWDAAKAFARKDDDLELETYITAFRNDMLTLGDETIARSEQGQTLDAQFEAYRTQLAGRHNYLSEQLHRAESVVASTQNIVIGDHELNKLEKREQSAAARFPSRSPEEWRILVETFPFDTEIGLHTAKIRHDFSIIKSGDPTVIGAALDDDNVFYLKESVAAAQQAHDLLLLGDILGMGQRHDKFLQVIDDVSNLLRANHLRTEFGKDTAYYILNRTAQLPGILSYDRLLQLWERGIFEGDTADSIALRLDEMLIARYERRLHLLEEAIHAPFANGQPRTDFTPGEKPLRFLTPQGKSLAASMHYRWAFPLANRS